ncbi:hypothetical protein PGT21_034119 [Puccinia graminis f. sp. tritici]|uniref:Uncharacterized protein n=1 Tax=Puccinia graminis f. sp. tritici TaxID=56615 RepID=A0A5B0MFA0_PUCGR|nr:hypothetical protein PGT21_034119 [Puccinia graminis f. sp. tritici]
MSDLTPSEHNSSAMDTGSNSSITSSAPVHRPQIADMLRSVELCVAGLQEHTEGAVQPITGLLHKIEESLEKIQEQLAHGAQPSQSSGIAERNVQGSGTEPQNAASGVSILLNPPEMTVDRITTYDQYVPVFDVKRVPADLVKYVEALKNMNFEDKVLMSSSTIERNELYQDSMLQLKQLESEMIKSALQRPVLPISITHREKFLFDLSVLITKTLNMRGFNSNCSRCDLRGIGEGNRGSNPHCLYG